MSVGAGLLALTVFFFSNASSGNSSMGYEDYRSNDTNIAGHQNLWSDHIHGASQGDVADGNAESTLGIRSKKREQGTNVTESQVTNITSDTTSSVAHLNTHNPAETRVDTTGRPTSSAAINQTFLATEEPKATVDSTEMTSTLAYLSRAPAYLTTFHPAVTSMTEQDIKTLSEVKNPTFPQTEEPKVTDDSTEITSTLVHLTTDPSHLTTYHLPAISITVPETSRGTFSAVTDQTLAELEVVESKVVVKSTESTSSSGHTSTSYVISSTQTPFGANSTAVQMTHETTLVPITVQTIEFEVASNTEVSTILGTHAIPHSTINNSFPLDNTTASTSETSTSDTPTSKETHLTQEPATMTITSPKEAVTTTNLPKETVITSTDNMTHTTEPIPRIHTWGNHTTDIYESERFVSNKTTAERVTIENSTEIVDMGHRNRMDHPRQDLHGMDITTEEGNWIQNTTVHVMGYAPNTSMNSTASPNFPLITANFMCVSSVLFLAIERICLY